jgi:anthranilate phosphoribosyltransferase
MSDSSWKYISDQLESKIDLTTEEVHWAMGQILEGKATSDDIKSYLTKLTAKGESASEISAMIDQMYSFAMPITVPDRAVDIVGTGGDGFNTINISTTAAIVTTAAGARVVKHGNRAASSMAGSADFLEALGININISGEGVAEIVRQIGIGFCFAPKFHPALRFAAPARKELGVSTIFNILGPLANPAKPVAIAVGVAKEKFQPVMADVLAQRGCEGFVFRGDDGIDELSLSTTSTVYQINDGKYRVEKFDPSNLGIESAPISELVGGDAAHNVKIAKEIFSGKESAAKDAVILNAAAAIAAFKADFNLSVEQQFANGVVLARKAIESGAATDLVGSWAKLSHEIAAIYPA